MQFSSGLLSPFSAKVRIALAEKGLACDLREIRWSRMTLWGPTVAAGATRTLTTTGASSASARSPSRWRASSDRRGSTSPTWCSTASSTPPRYAASSLIAPADTLLSPDAIAEIYWQLHAQDRRAWTLELDLRPAVEKF
jgi:hypothetical protein